MFILPNDFSCLLWPAGRLEFETELQPAEPGPGPACGEPGAGLAGLPPPMRLVVRSVRWVECPVWSARANPQWEQMTQLQREQDEQRLRQRAHTAPVAPAAPAAPGAGAPPQD
ncbi:hypothetical protein [Azohydromonas aeria]|uniref:hypothetical protein n=1 Tax=Azohydromonas aeria TaxID=2590212 RepID=UPI0012F7A7A1|nr:hypothetical protein [Azohydromonas aeria]